MKKYQVLFVSVLFLLFCMTGAYAQDKAIKIGYLDLSRVFDEYQRTKEYDSLLEARHSEYQTQRNAKLEKLKESQSKIALLKEEEKAKLEQEIEKNKADLLEFDRQKQTDLRKERDDRIREILLEIEKVVKDYAQKEGYTLVLNDRVLVYGGEEMNITDKIVKLLNESYPKK